MTCIYIIIGLDWSPAIKYAVAHAQRLPAPKHQVFRLSFDAQQIKGDDNICSVLKYIHHNPVSGKWRLAKDFMSYPYSNADFYDSGTFGGVAVFHYQDMV